MNTVAEEPRSTGQRVRHIVLLLFLIGCGCVLFVAAGIAGAFATLTWLI